MLGHKASLSKYKKIEITPCILPDHYEIKLEFNNKSISRKYTNNWGKQHIAQRLVGHRRNKRGNQRVPGS
jgi:hypothetical protein